MGNQQWGENNVSPLEDNDLGKKIGQYNSKEFTFAKMYGKYWFLWFLLPIIGWFILMCAYIIYLVRTKPTRIFGVYENGFIWKKGNAITKVMYTDVDSLYFNKVKVYRNGGYMRTDYSFQTMKDKQRTFKLFTYDINENNLEEKKSYLVRAFEAAEDRIQMVIIERALAEYKSKGYVDFKDDEVIVGDGFLRDKTGYDFKEENISKVYFDEGGDLNVEAIDYKSEILGHKGHKLELSMDTNFKMKLYILQQLMGWDL